MGNIPAIDCIGQLGDLRPDCHRRKIRSFLVAGLKEMRNRTIDERTAGFWFPVRTEGNRAVLPNFRVDSIRPKYYSSFKNKEVATYG